MTSDSPDLSRRRVLQCGVGGSLALAAASRSATAAEAVGEGLVVGQAEGAEVGRRVLADGGNAADALVAAALVAGVVSISNCGIGGYGGHAVIGLPDGKVTAIDFNSTAPAAARPNMFVIDAKGNVPGGVNKFGWLAAGVPGTMAGLQKVLDLHGTRSLSQVIEPAICYARDGFAMPAGLAQAMRTFEPQFRKDPGSARLFLASGKPPAAGETFRNPDLAALLARLAKDNNVAAFYRGDIAGQIAAEFKKHGGLVTTEDLAKYEAREVTPLSFAWRGQVLHTAPLTAGGLSVLQSLASLAALNWDRWDADAPRTAHAYIEALRLAWHDRLTLLGDPQGNDVPGARLLSAAHAQQSAGRIRAAVEAGKLIALGTDGRPAGGTIHLSAVDAQGMMVALTLTHGEGCGARVTVEGLGLLLGHGMSRFDPRAGHPNSVRAGCRPLNNMCPMIICQDNRPVVALGATGGRRIPNTMCDVLTRLVGRGASIVDAFAAPRLHTEGDETLQLGKGWSEENVAYLRQVGYRISPGTGANLNAIARDPASGALAHVPA